MRIQRPSSLSVLTALKDCDPPDTCITASVRPCVGRTAPSANGIQSIWFFITPVTAPCCSGVDHTCASDHCDSSRSSCTLGCVAGTLPKTGSSRGLKNLTSAPSAEMIRPASSARSRLYERSRSEPYRNRTRGACVDRTTSGSGVSASGYGVEYWDIALGTAYF